MPQLGTRRSSDELRERIKAGGGSLEAAARVLRADMLGMDAEEECFITNAAEQDTSAHESASTQQEPDVSIDVLFQVNYNNFENVRSEKYKRADEVQDFQEPGRD
jgi:hypothetical protein